MNCVERWRRYVNRATSRVKDFLFTKREGYYTITKIESESLLTLDTVPPEGVKAGEWFDVVGHGERLAQIPESLHVGTIPERGDFKVDDELMVFDVVEISEGDKLYRIRQTYLAKVVTWFKRLLRTRR
jgi:hypothetical protein